MHFYGFQKMTLLDYPGKVACTLFTGGCQFRCPFCHNASLITGKLPDRFYTEEEIVSFLEKRRGLLDGVCITGGEPLLQEDLLPFLRRIRAMGYAVKLDTNGGFPARLRAAIDAGVLDYVAMDLKNCREKYGQTIGISGYDTAPIAESISLLLEERVEYEFRTTVAEPLHTVCDIASAAAWIHGARRYFLQQFEDSGDLIGKGLMPCSEETLHAMQEAASISVQNTQLRGV